MELLQMIKDRIAAIKTKDRKNGDVVILEDLQDIHRQIKMAEKSFDTLTDQDLIESCIFQMEALEVRYNYLVKQAKEKGIRNSEYVDLKEVGDINESTGDLGNNSDLGSNYAVLLQTEQETS